MDSCALKTKLAKSENSTKSPSEKRRTAFVFEICPFVGGSFHTGYRSLVQGVKSKLDQELVCLFEEILFQKGKVLP